MTKSFTELMTELTLKKDKDLPNLKMPVPGPKGKSKRDRLKSLITPYTSAIHAAKESIDNHPKVKAARKAHAAGTWDGNVNKEGEAVVHINGKPHTVTNRYGQKKQSNPDNYKPFAKEEQNGLMKEGTPGAKLHPIAQYVRDKEKRLKNKEGTPGANDADMKHHYMYHDDAKAARAHATKVGGKVIKGSGKRGPEYSVKYKNKNYKESVDQLDEKMNPFTKVLKKNRKLISNDHVTTHRNNKFYVIIDDEELNALSTMDSESIFISLKKNKGIGYTENDLTAYFKTAKDANQFVKDIKGPRYSNNRQFDVVGESVNEATWPDEMPPETHHKDCGTEACCGECVEETADTDTNEALNMSQRIKRSRLMKRMKGRIMVGRRRAKKKMANKGTLEKRSMRQARNELAKKLTRGVPKSELTFARKQEIEKRLEKPALQQRIKRLAKRKFKDVRKKEVERKKG